MTREQIIDFMQQLSFMLQQLQQSADKLNQAKAVKDILSAQGAHEQALQIAAKVVEGQANVDGICAAICEKAKRGTIESAETLLRDLEQLLRIAEESQAEWRMESARIDVESRLVPPDPDFQREIRESVASAARHKYEAALAAASDIVPQPGIVLL